LEWFALQPRQLVLDQSNEFSNEDLGGIHASMGEQVAEIRSFAA
jgi:hypothetical protein